MKHFLLFLLLNLSLLHADMVETYLQKVITTEEVVNAHENGTEKMEGRTKEEDKQFLVFFLEYASNIHNGKLKLTNPYRSALFKLERRIETNKHLENNYAVYRDELKKGSLEFKLNIRTTLKKVVEITEGNNYETFEEKLQEIIIERHASEPKLNLKRYEFVRDIKTLDPLTQSLLDNLREYIALQDVHNDLSALLIEDSASIYKIAIMSDYGILSFAVSVEESPFGKSLTPYLEPFLLSSSKLIYLVILVVLALLVRILVVLIMRRIYKLITRKEKDVEYLVSMTRQPFHLLLFVIVTEFIFIIISGLSDVSGVFTTYEIIYVLLAVFLVYRIGNAIAVVKMEEMSMSKHIRNEVVNLGLKLLNVIMGLIALIVILKLLGVDLTALLSGLGIGGVAVAFAAKDTLSNFFGSVSILMSEMFEQGDWIAVDNMEGTVVEIGLRATTIRTFDNALIAIPNFKLADNGIKNWSRRIMGRRIKMTLGVTYESDMDNIKQALLDIRKMLNEHPDIVTEKTEYANSDRQHKLVSKEDLKGIKRMIMVNLDAFNSSSIDILVYCFSRSVVWKEWQEVKEDVMFKIADILKANDLEFAYPTMMIHQEEGQKERIIE